MKYIANLYTRAALALSMVAALASCSDESLLPDPAASGDEGCITFRCADMIEVYKGKNNFASRADLSKNQEEKKVNTLHVFFFDQESGDLLESNVYANFPAYQKVTNISLLKVPTGDGIENIFGSTAQDKKVRIVAIANIDATDACDSAEDAANMFCTEKYSPEGEIRQAGREATGERWVIHNISQLREWVYYPRVRMDKGAANDISRLPAAGMPMIGELDVDLSEKPVGEQYIVNMIALMAKINVSVTLDPKQSTKDFPVLKITEYGVKNMPLAVPFTQCDGHLKEGKSAVKPESYKEYVDTYNVTNAPMYHNDGTACPEDREFNPVDKDFVQGVHEYTTSAGLPMTINKDSEPVTFSYYTYENIQLPNYTAKRPNGVNEDTDAFDSNFNFKRPTGLKNDADLQRWKPTIAYESCASALILKGEYTTDQELTYKAQFTIYIGGDTQQDKTAADYEITSDEDANFRNFKVKRNHQYNNNIVIHGLDYVRNTSDRVYTFDGRVNVVTDNPLYLSIINERMVDAHATALPMDIWITNTDDAWIDGDITFTILDRDNEKSGKWIRMQYVDAATMAHGRLINGVQVAYAPGTGCYDYFAYDLVTNTLANNYEVKVPAATGNRSRIYFYIDENVPTSNSQTDYGPRSYEVEIVYDVVTKDGTRDHRRRTLDIDQAALLKVEGWHSSDNDVPATWMEYYEEYLEHYDPLDRHEQPGELYEGLHWGLNGVNCSYNLFTNPNGYVNPESRYDASQIYTKTSAFGMTQWAINRSDTQPITTVKLFNDSAPASAFHYCYGKNKREANGNVHLETSTRGWYMPGIRELEQGLTTYYELFNEFKDNKYWSAAAADGSNNHARATGVEVTSSGTKYLESKNSNDPGFVARTGVALRIRAFYRVD